jgi:elongation factor Ts
MAEITASQVNELRRMTGLGLMECKTLLREADGDMERAVTLAKEKGMVKAAGRAGRAATAGRVEAALAPDGKAGALVELNCETDFVARNDDFRRMVRQLAEHVLAQATSDREAVLGSTLPDQGRTVRDALLDLNARTGENVSLSRVAYLGGAGQVDYYIHHDGMKGAMVQLSGPADPALVKEIAMHIVAAPVKPLGVRREEIAPEAVAEQRRIFQTQIANQMGDKPESVREKIATGKLDAWYKETVLLEQEFIKDPARKIKDVVSGAGKELTITRFVHFVVGESSEATAGAA